jgi:hypothetical protein
MQQNTPVDNSNNYLGSGYNQYFQKQVIPLPPSPSITSPFDFSSQFNSFGANQIGTGSMKSNNNHLTLDLDNEAFSVSDGSQERVRLGKLQDGTYGITIKDQNGIQLLNLSGNNNTISSSDGSLILDFTNTQLLIKDQTGNTIVLIGKQVGGF